MKISDKRHLVRLLAGDDFALLFSELAKFPPAQAINPLFAGLSHHREKIRWHAISAMGQVAARLANADLEAGRVVMRRLMWSLNDESGGIGWGAPEAMAEIMVCHEGLAREFAHILVSYMREDGNFLELPALQRGLLWGIGRLAQARVSLLRDLKAADYLEYYLSEDDPTVRGMAARALGLLKAKNVVQKLEKLTFDQSEIRHYLDRELFTTKVGDLARNALNNIKD